MRCVLVGNYGVGNVGDEALKEYFLSTFPEVEWTVVLGSQKQGVHDRKRIVPRLPFGLRSLFAPWWRTLGAIRNADFVVFGGGSLFTDSESVWACVLWWMYAAAARFFGTRYILAFQGIGPLRTALARSFTASAVQHAAFISVRDEESLARVHELTPRVDPILSFDPAFSLFVRHAPHTSTKETFVIVPRANPTEEFFTCAQRSIGSSEIAVTILLLEPERESEVARRLRSICPRARTVSITTVAELLSEMSRGSSAITQRYHGALAALALSVPIEIIPQREGDKMDALKKAVASPHTKDEWLSRVKKGERALAKLLSH